MPSYQLVDSLAYYYANHSYYAIIIKTNNVLHALNMVIISFEIFIMYFSLTRYQLKFKRKFLALRALLIQLQY